MNCKGCTSKRTLLGGGGGNGSARRAGKSTRVATNVAGIQGATRAELGNGMQPGGSRTQTQIGAPV